MAFALALCLTCAVAVAAKVMSVSVRDGQVRETPSFLGKIVGKATYGQSVDVGQEQGDWAKVTLPGGVSGWMHRSALTTEKLALTSGQGTAGGVSGGRGSFQTVSSTVRLSRTRASWRCIFSTGATCSCPVRARRDDCPRTCRASGTTGCGRRGNPTII